MDDDKIHLQIRISPDLRSELERISKKYEISSADTIRGILFFGLPVFEGMTDMSYKLVKSLLEKMKKEARIKS